MGGINAADVATITGAVLTLVVLEGLLSADNALVLAVMVRHLPRHQQTRALRYGIVGAFFFRFIAILFASLLLAFWIFKVAGGLYLLYLAMSRLAFGEEKTEAGDPAKEARSFWRTVIFVELADIAFSIDSIVAAVAMAEGLPDRLQRFQLLVVYLGGVLGIVTMRFVAGLFIRLIERFRGLAVGAYALVAWIGVKLIGSGLDNAIHPRVPIRGGWQGSLPRWILRLPLEMSDWVFWIGMALILGLSLVYRPRAGAKSDALVSAAETEAH